MDRGSTQALPQAPTTSQPSASIPSTLQCCRRGAAPYQGSAVPLAAKRGLFCIPRHGPRALSRLQQPLAHRRGQTPTLTSIVLRNRSRCRHKQDTHALFD